MAIESALIPVCLPLIQFSLKQPERFVQRNRTKIIKNVSALRLGLQHTRFRSAFDDPRIIEQMPFTSTRDGNFEIYAMNADGTGVTRLTNHPAADAKPSWSPDGTKIAFTSNRDGNFEIYAMNTDGTGVTRLTNHAAADISPAWSPNG